MKFMCGKIVLMSGHSKWSNIKRKKGVNDAKRSKTFTKMSNLITIAVKKGGKDPDSNPSLRLAIDKAKEARMPKDNIERAISRGLGNTADGSLLEEVIYEGYSPMGVAFLVYAVTDNRNRTVAEIKTVFNKNGGSLGTPGSTSYIFDSNTKEPSFKVSLEDENVMEQILDLEAALEDHDDVQEVYSNYD